MTHGSRRQNAPRPKLKPGKIQIYCHFDNAWIDLGRARTRCPSCGAEIASDSVHEVRIVDAPNCKPRSAPGATP